MDLFYDLGQRGMKNGEKSTAYFLNLETRNRVKKTINKLQDGNKVVTDQNEIRELQADFYKELYRSRKSSTLDDMKNYIDSTPVISLSDDEKASLEGLITFEECQKAIKSFKKNKSPGNDGLTIEFYQIFWPLIGTSLVDAFNFSFEAGELSSFQKQAVITLLDQ